MMSSFFLGSYATFNNSPWDRHLESKYYLGLKKLPFLQGLEIPFTGSLHPHDDEWFLKNISPDWNFVMTCLPGLMDRLAHRPAFGLASDDESGRLEAMEFYKLAFEAVMKLNHHLGRSVVKAIEIHSGPTRSDNVTSSMDSFKKSLKTLSEWDWKDCQVIVEHCDAYVAGQKSAKGFMNIKDEIKAILEVNENSKKPIKMLINWGRSVLEGRSASTVLEHLHLVKKAELLEGLIFSGCTKEENPWGIWKDNHVPPAPLAQKSLMTRESMKACFEIADPKVLKILGLKVTNEPGIKNVESSISLNGSALKILEDCLS